jgi:hypothetical protein
MKPYTQYLQEMNRVYEFVVKLANCDYNSVAEDKLKSALDIYAVENVGKAKTLPIQEHSDFPGQGPCECCMLEVAVRYPVVSDQIAQVIAEKLGIPKKQVLVRTKGEEEIRSSFYQPKKAKDGSVLSNPDLDSESGAQGLVGQSRKDSLLKELESRKYEFASKAEKTKTVEMPTGNNISPVGSKQNKIPSPVKGK